MWGREFISAFLYLNPPLHSDSDESFTLQCQMGLH